MKELFTAAASAPNLIPTLLLAFVMIYWLVVLIGAIDIDSLDVDIDVDTDVDVDVDADVDGELSGGGFDGVLAFFNLGQVPLMVFLTFWILPVWVLSVLGNYYIGNASFLIGLLVLLPSLIVGLFIAKVLTNPLAKVFGKLNQESNETVIGKICTITSQASHQRVGQARVKTSGAPLLLNVKTYEGVSLDRGDTAMVIEQQQGRNIYFIEPYID
ncbi:MAG: hypothetical protein AAGE93_27830 [Bacteroidota bacterium]